MRIGQVVALVTPEGAYGGPVRVAVNQARALIAQGHEVVVFAGTRGFPSGPRQIEGVPFVLFDVNQVIPGTGFAGLTSFKLLREVRDRALDFDVWHIHLARDFLTLIAAHLIRRARIPYVLQCHGMIDPSSHPLSFPLDAALTRPVLYGAFKVLALTPQEEHDLALVAPNLRSVTRVINGVPQSSARLETTLPIVKVLYLARLQKRKRPVLFVQAAVENAAAAPNSYFALVGPDEGEGPSVKALIENSGLSNQIVWEGWLPPEDTLARMSEASFYVLPSVNEPFPMSVLEALSLGIPVVITDTCGLAPYVQAANAGIVVDASLEALRIAIRTLINDAKLRAAMGQNATALIKERFSVEAVAIQLADHYQRAQSLPAPKRHRRTGLTMQK